MPHALTPLLLGALLVTAACSPDQAGTAAAPPQSPAPPADSLAPPPASAEPTQAIRYHCDDLDFTALYDADHVTLQAPGREYRLPQVRAASGAKFQNDKAMFWSRGEQADVQIDGSSYSNCRERAASEAPPAP